jgi:uncharacterized membrane protein YfcA
MNPITGLLIALGALNALFVGAWGKVIASARHAVKPSPATDVRFPTGLQLGVGFVTNFFDTLGIGSYAPTTAMFKLKKMVNDRIIPGTLTVGHNLSTTVQTFIFTAIVPVDVTTLFTMIGASILGAWLGAGVVAKWPKRKIQIGMGIALLCASILIFFLGGGAQPGPFEQLTGIKVLTGGEAIGVSGAKLGIAAGINFLLGA